MAEMRILFADGTVLDTASEDSRAAFLRSHAELCEGVSALAAETQADEELVALINKKYVELVLFEQRMNYVEMRRRLHTVHHPITPRLHQPTAPRPYTPPLL